MKNKQYNHGFITLFFILTVSFTFLTWVSISSERIFEYIYIKEVFFKNREILQNHILCSDSFINNFIGSRYNLSFTDNIYDFNRNLYYADNYKCQIKNISIVNQAEGIKHIFFISGDFSFEYKLKNGFINFNKSFNLF